MSDNDTLKDIARDLSQIEQHLTRINGRLDKVEEIGRNNKEIGRNNKQDIAVISARCKLVTQYTDGDIERLSRKQQNTEQELWEWFKGNGVQLGEIGALLFLVGKVSGWW